MTPTIPKGISKDISGEERSGIDGAETILTDKEFGL